VAGRRKDFRTWDELSMSERRRGLTILAGAGVVAVGVVLLVYGGTSGDSTPAGAPPPAISADAAARAPASPAATGPDLDAWYAAIAGFRTDIGQAEAASPPARCWGRARPPRTARVSARRPATLARPGRPA
jgi:hypothetical protein